MFLHLQLVLDEDKKIKLALKIDSSNEVDLIHHRVSDALDRTDNIDPVLLQMLDKPTDVALIALFGGLSLEVKELTAIADADTVAKGLAQQAEELAAKEKAVEGEVVVEA